MDFKEWIRTEIGESIIDNKYRFNNETLDIFLDRVSNGDEKLRQLILEKKFLFGGRILASRGLQKFGRKVTYSNCFVGKPPEDNIESIFDAAKNMAITYSRGGGAGIDISQLRPKGSIVNNSAKTTSGAVSFMELYGVTTSLIGQNGRRGALMISIDCSHPDLVEFIGIKENLDIITSANISIRASDDFMEAIRSRKPWTLSFTVKDTGQIIEKVVDARKLFEKIAFNNWDVGEPGVLFWDTINDWFLLSEYKNFKFHGVNPCAEQPLPEDGSCLLGSLNLSQFVDNPFTSNARFNFFKYKEAVRTVIQGLHDVLMEGMDFLPLEAQRLVAMAYRQMGLGYMGFADMLIKLGVRFGSEESIELAHKIGTVTINEALQKSSEIAIKDGSFPEFNLEDTLNSSFFIENATNETIKQIKENGLAHSQLLTCAPTGTLSTMLGISGGMEPIYMYSYDRKTESLHGEDVTYKIYTPIVKEYMRVKDLDNEKDLPDFFTNAMLLKPTERINMQAAWQKHIDASISSTINVPEETTVDDIVEIYLEAWEKGLKGITIFRDGCRRAAILSAFAEAFVDVKNETHAVPTIDKLKWGTTLATSEKLHGLKRKLSTDIGNIHLQAWFEKKSGKVREIWLIESSGGGYSDLVTALSRVLSAALRTGVDLRYITQQMDSISVNDDNSITSEIARTLLDMQQEYYKKNGIKEDAPMIVSPDIKVVVKDTSDGTCPKCGSPVIFTNGCMNCISCGGGTCDHSPTNEKQDLTINLEIKSKED